jgi:class 3 adenylate cyclase
MEPNADNAAGTAMQAGKLVVVLHADVEGYSRLIGRDDRGTVARLRALRQSLIEPAMLCHGGTTVQTGGDSMLVVFDSIDGAVQCALAIQREVPARDGEQPPEQRIRFRMGINIGTRSLMAATCTVTPSTWPSGYNPSVRLVAFAYRTRCGIRSAAARTLRSRISGSCR